MTTLPPASFVVDYISQYAGTICPIKKAFTLLATNNTCSVRGSKGQFLKLDLTSPYAGLLIANHRLRVMFVTHDNHAICKAGRGYPVYHAYDNSVSFVPAVDILTAYNSLYEAALKADAERVQLIATAAAYRLERAIDRHIANGVNLTDLTDLYSHLSHLKEVAGSEYKRMVRSPRRWADMQQGKQVAVTVLAYLVDILNINRLAGGVA